MPIFYYKSFLCIELQHILWLQSTDHHLRLYVEYSRGYLKLRSKISVGKANEICTLQLRINVGDNEYSDKTVAVGGMLHSGGKGTEIGLEMRWFYWPCLCATVHLYVYSGGRVVVVQSRYNRLLYNCRAH